MITLKQFSKSSKIGKTQKYSRNNKKLKLTKTFKIPKAEVSGINKLLKNINIKKYSLSNNPITVSKNTVIIVHLRLCNIIK